MRFAYPGPSLPTMLRKLAAFIVIVAVMAVLTLLYFRLNPTRLG